VIAFVALATWINPQWLGIEFVRWFVLLMVVEFIVVHSTGFLGGIAFSDEAPRRRLIGTALVGGFYTLFLLGAALGFKSWWPIISFWSLTLNRLLGAVIIGGDQEAARAYVGRTWVAGVLFYLLAVFPTTILPMPEFGITSSVRRALDLPGEGLWISEPHRAVIFAMLYFGLVGFSELYSHRWAVNLPGKES